MNYRRGFQRVYVVCSVLWIVGVLTISVRNRPRTIDYDTPAKKAGAIEVDPSKVTDLPPDAVDVPNTKANTPFVPPPLSSYKGDAPEDHPAIQSDNGPLRIVRSEPPPGAVRSYWIARSEIIVLPPSVIYSFVFYIVPWVYRGFRPGTQI